MEYSIYNVYNGQNEDNFFCQKDSINEFETNRLTTDYLTMNHLICDFDDVDQEYLQKQL